MPVTFQCFQTYHAKERCLMTAIEYNKCVDEYADGVYRFVLKNVRDKEKARDIVQDTFEKLWLKVATVRTEKAKTYLFTIAYHTMIDAIRKEKYQDDFEQVKEENYSTHNTFNDLKAILNRALTRLSGIQRSVILLRDYEGYSYDEIGEITGLNESQVKVYIYRARIILKEYIGKLDTVV
ncbi:MAG: RNA polymerase sigma factor [Bacteroidia bacterium]